MNNVPCKTRKKQDSRDMLATTAMIGGQRQVAYLIPRDTKPRRQQPRKPKRRADWVDERVTPKTEGYLAALALLNNRSN